MMLGGSLAQGKTSNRELDNLFEMYLPPDSVLPCTPLDQITESLIGNLIEWVKKTGKTKYLPIFLRHHCLAGLLAHYPKPNTTILYIYDSAPSRIVKQDVVEHFRAVAPRLQVTFLKCVKQERYSDDCGVFMASRFFADSMGIRIKSPNTAPKRLRAVLSEAVTRKRPAEEFREDVQDRPVVPERQGDALPRPLSGAVEPRPQSRIRIVTSTHRSAQEPAVSTPARNPEEGNGSAQGGQRGPSAGIGAQGSGGAHGEPRGPGGGHHAANRPHERGHPATLPGLFPATYAGGRTRAGQRLRADPRAKDLGHQAPSWQNMGLAIRDLHNEIRRLSGQPMNLALGHPRTWPLHLKDVTLANLDEIRALPCKSQDMNKHLDEALSFLRPDKFRNVRTSRTIKPTKLEPGDIERAVAQGKFEEVPDIYHPLTEGVHSVKVFWVPEHKGRRRLITKPAVNGVILKDELLRIQRPSRLTVRQDLRDARYMLQIDFDAFYDSIPLPEDCRNVFVFRMGQKMYRCRTLPTGARWSVAVGQAITSKIVDIETHCTIHTMIDNILVAAKIGQEAEFVRTVREVTARIVRANLQTTPTQDWLNTATDDDLLQEARRNTTFLGEEYTWLEGERRVRNSLKSIAKLHLGLQKTSYSCREFVSLVSLMMYMLHTTRLNPAGAFPLMMTYRGVFSAVERGKSWDDVLSFISDGTRNALHQLGEALLRNEWYAIAPRVEVPLSDNAYDLVCFTDASLTGWGAILSWRNRYTEVMQQRWTHQTWQENVDPDTYEHSESKKMFLARHSAHSEPTAIRNFLLELLRTGLHDGTKIAIATDHEAIVRAQRRLNGFGGIGRGYALNKLYELTNELFHTRNITVLFFYVLGHLNPADSYSRHFGENTTEQIIRYPENNVGLPLLEQTASPLLSETQVLTVGFGIPKP